MAVELTKAEHQKLIQKSSVAFVEKDAIVKGSSQKSWKLLNKKIHKKKEKKIKKNESKNEWNLRMIHADNMQLSEEEQTTENQKPDKKRLGLQS